MSDEVTIDDIQVLQPRSLPPEVGRGDQQKRVPIAITVRNRSATRTFHVVASLRSLSYDAATRTVRLDLHEPEPPPEITLTTIFPPAQVALRPGATTVLTVEVPLVFREAASSDGLGLKIATVDLSGMEHVTATVAYSEAPYHQRADLSARERMKDLRAWGRTAQSTFDRTIPAGAGDTRPSST